MGHLIILIVHLITTVLRGAQPGGVHAVIAESVFAKHQLLIINRSRRRAPNLCILDRFNRWILFALDYLASASAGSYRVQAFHAVEFPSRDGATKVSAAVFAEADNRG